jgi:hypothetical protein
MDPFSVIDIIKKVIDDRVKNLHPKLEEIIIKKVIDNKLKSKKSILKFIRHELNLPKNGTATRIYWLRRGWSDNEIEIKRKKEKKPYSPMKVDNWLNKINNKTGKLYTKDEAKFKINSFRKMKKEYWMERGYSLEESENKIVEYQKDNSKKFIQKMINNPDMYKDIRDNQIGFYIKKGYSLEESKNLLKYRQDTKSLNFFIKKYGEDDGIIKYNRNIIEMGYKSSRQYYIDKYGYNIGNKKYTDILIKRIVPMSKASKESVKFFTKIYNFLIEKGILKKDIYWGVNDSNEWFINKNKNLFFYDFTIKSLKIIIEYNGTKYHPNPVKDTKETWMSLNSIEFNMKLIEDELKKSLAVSQGFDYYVVFSNDDLQLKQNQIINKLDKKIKEICQ